MLKYNPYPQQKNTIYYSHINFTQLCIILDMQFHLKRLPSNYPNVLILHVAYLQHNRHYYLLLLNEKVKKHY